MIQYQTIVNSYGSNIKVWFILKKTKHTFWLPNRVNRFFHTLTMTQTKKVWVILVSMLCRCIMVNLAVLS